MRILYRTKKLKKVCEVRKEGVKKYGSEMGKIIPIRIDQIRNADSVLHLVQYGVGRCHELIGDRKGQYAMDLIHPYRLIFTQNDAQTVTVTIEEISDYH